MNIYKMKKAFKKSAFFQKINKVYDKICIWHRMRGRYTFVNHSKGSDRLCIVLAGYKEYLYPSVLGRLKAFAPKDIDVCILTAGLNSSVIASWCEECGWSYLRTKRNNVSLIQNIAIQLHPSAQYIYKLDEDIFITENYFDKMLRAYHHAEVSDYIPGVVAPLIPINGYGHLRILKKLNLVKDYEELFGRPRCQRRDDYPVECNSKVALFFWGNDSKIPSIDEMNRDFETGRIEEYPCPIQFSIGAILFKRNLWQDMKMFPVSRVHNLGMDERSLSYFCCVSSRPIMVSENIVVGHLSFQAQNQSMKEYYLSNTDKFLPPTLIPDSDFSE